MGSSFSKQKHAKGAKAGGHAKAPKASKVPKRYKAPKASRAPRPSKPSKPFYPAKAPKTPNPPRKNIKPSPHKPLSYPTLATLPPRGRPIPHNPRTEEEAAKRYNAILAANPVFAGRQKAPSAPLPPVPQKAKTPKPKAKPQPQASFQFMPLSEIGALPKAKAKADGNSGYGLYPPAQKGDSRGEPSAVPTKQSSRPAPQARFGGTRKDRHGEWWVLLLADGRWYRSIDLGIQPPKF